MIKKPKIFISGVAGFLGSHLADIFIAEGYKVAGCDNLIGGYLDNVPSEVEFYQYDLNFHNSVVKITKDCDIIFHCAATAYEGLSVFSPYFVTKNIVESSVSLITAAIANKAERFVFCSSMARYGTQDKVPFTEDMTPKPQDPYGIGKFSSELFLRNLCETHGMDYVIAVPHNIIGPRQKYDDPYRNVASIMINLMLQGRQPIIYGDGEQKRCFSFIQDDIDILYRLAFEKSAVGEVINIGPDDEFVTINQLAGCIAEIIDFQLDPIYERSRPQEVVLANCSAEKARMLFGYTPKTRLKDGLRSMVEYIKTRGPKPFKYHIDLEIINSKTPDTWKNRKF
ncbi:MAG TPA: NAD-dependent epimerase/dehydratase family protein [Clostridiales bacterium]|nr:NAD-dependent epimerase/dehydratase family protein [Clostridiales bacterium]HQP68821.1 NAD-dependent epimerase/dehydratase family protein [Clostridiales bacterium]